MSETVLITGGTGRIGNVLVRAVSDEGYNVIFTGRAQDKIRELEGAVKNTKGYTCDFSAPAGVEDFLETLRADGVKPDHLINNFRSAENLKTGSKGIPSEAQWIVEYKNAVVTPYHLVNALAASLKSVVNITSIYGVVAANMSLYDGDQSRSPVHYSVAKAAENHLTREMAVRMAPRNIRVNAVAYGGIKGRATKEFEEKYSALCPSGGMIEGEDIPGAVLFLLSKKSARITGQILAVDGGWTVW